MARRPSTFNILRETTNPLLDVRGLGIRFSTSTDYDFIANYILARLFKTMLDVEELVLSNNMLLIRM